MHHAEDFYMSQAAQVKLSNLTNGRALVLGDAAFATFGVGTSLAIESAYILAGELSKIQRSNDVPQALENTRRSFANYMQQWKNSHLVFHRLHFHRLPGAFA